LFKTNFWKIPAILMDRFAWVLKFFFFCFWWSEVMFDWSKGFKLQFEGFKESVFKAFILFAWIKPCFTWESKAYQSRLLVFDQKGLDWACNVGFDYEEKGYLLAQKVFKGFQD
jgi:hypothetical protein